MSNTTLPSKHRDRLWTVADVADYLQLSTSWVYKRTAEGTLPCIRLGASVRFDPEAIAEYASAQRGPNALQSRTGRAR